jgi:transposase
VTRKRTREPDRQQGVIRFELPEANLPPMHPARVLWDVSGTLDLTRFVRNTKAEEGRQGRSTLSPRMKLCLWLYGVSQGIGSSREIARSTKTDDGFRWIVGDLSVHHDTLSDFRARHREEFDALLSDVLGALLHKGVLSLDLVAQDGMRVRASATAPSFRSYGSLLQCREQAKLHVKAVLAQAGDPELTAAQQARRAAAAKDFQRRVEEAIATVQELQQSRKPSDGPARASTTDAEARVMKMADGGFRPAYNVQLATAGSELGGARTIVGVRVTNVGSDMNSVSPMLDEIERRTGLLPKVLLADANHTGYDGIRDAAERDVTLLAAVPERSQRPGSHTAAMDEAVVSWRERMETDEARRLYRARASLCELMNAHISRLRGVDQFLVRGLGKVTSVVLLAAIASNLLQHASALLG